MFYAVVISDAESDTESDADAYSDDGDTNSDDELSEWPDPDGVCGVCNYEFENGPFKGTVHDDICSLYCFGLMQNHQ